VQHRFTKGSLCQTVLTSSFDKIIGFPDKGNLVDLIYLEFNKAFDMVPHGKLLVKLEKMRINRRTLKWRLEQRQQQNCHRGNWTSERLLVGVRKPCFETEPGKGPPSRRLGADR